MIASSVASTVASMMPFMSSLDIIWMVLGPPRRNAPGFAVENARKMSPDPLPAVPPVRADAERNALGDATQLVRRERRVGGGDRDDRTAARGFDTRRRSSCAFRSP